MSVLVFLAHNRLEARIIHETPGEEIVYIYLPTFNPNGSDVSRTSTMYADDYAETGNGFQTTNTKHPLLVEENPDDFTLPDDKMLCDESQISFFCLAFNINVSHAHEATEGTSESPTVKSYARGAIDLRDVNGNVYATTTGEIKGFTSGTGCGEYVTIETDQVTTDGDTIYLRIIHIIPSNSLVVGKEVTSSSLIGKVASNCTSPHVHIEAFSYLNNVYGDASQRRDVEIRFLDKYVQTMSYPSGLLYPIDSNVIGVEETRSVKYYSDRVIEDSLVQDSQTTWPASVTHDWPSYDSGELVPNPYLTGEKIRFGMRVVPFRDAQLFENRGATILNQDALDAIPDDFYDHTWIVYRNYESSTAEYPAQFDGEYYWRIVRIEDAAYVEGTDAGKRDYWISENDLYACYSELACNIAVEDPIYPVVKALDAIGHPGHVNREVIPLGRTEEDAITVKWFDEDQLPYIVDGELVPLSEEFCDMSSDDSLYPYAKRVFESQTMTGIEVTVNGVSCNIFGQGVSAKRSDITKPVLGLLSGLTVSQLGGYIPSTKVFADVDCSNDPNRIEYFVCAAQGLGVANGFTNPDGGLPEFRPEVFSRKVDSISFVIRTNVKAKQLANENMTYEEAMMDLCIVSPTQRGYESLVTEFNARLSDPMSEDHAHFKDVLCYWQLLEQEAYAIQQSFGLDARPELGRPDPDNPGKFFLDLEDEMSRPGMAKFASLGYAFNNQGEAPDESHNDSPGSIPQKEKCKVLCRQRQQFSAFVDRVVDYFTGDASNKDDQPNTSSVVVASADPYMSIEMLSAGDPLLNGSFPLPEGVVDPDFFKVEVAANKPLNVVVIPKDPFTNLEVRLYYGANQEQFISDESEGDGFAHVSRTPVNGGTAVGVVFTTSSNTFGGLYELHISSPDIEAYKPLCPDYVDVPQGTAEFDAVCKVAALGGLNTANDYFNGYAFADKGQPIAIAVRIHFGGNVPEYPHNSCGFNDVPKGHTFFDEICWAREFGWITPANNFNPSEQFKYGYFIKTAVMVIDGKEPPVCEPGIGPFPSIQYGHTFYDYSCRLAEIADVEAMFGGATFHPDTSMNRFGIMKGFVEVYQAPYDITLTSPHRENAVNTFEKEIVSGCGYEMLCGDRDASYGDFIKMVVNQLGGVGWFPEGVQSYPDVPPTHSFYRFVEYLAYTYPTAMPVPPGSGMPLGVGESMLRIDAAQMTVEIKNLQGQFCGQMDTQSFSDWEPKDPGHQAFECLAASGILKGFSDGTIRGAIGMSRAEALTLSEEAFGNNKPLVYNGVTTRNQPRNTGNSENSPTPAPTPVPVPETEETSPPEPHVYFGGQPVFGEVVGATWQDGLVGKALYFDGNSYVRLSPEDTDLSGLDAYSMIAWVKLGEFNSGDGSCVNVVDGTNRRVLEVGSSPANSTALVVGNQSANVGVPYGWAHLDGVRKGQLNGYGHRNPAYETLYDCQWHHIAYLKYTNTAILMVDGEIVNQTSLSGMPTSPAGMTIGAANNNGVYSQFLVGLVDELHFRTDTIPPGQVTHLYNTTLQHYFTPEDENPVTEIRTSLPHACGEVTPMVLGEYHSAANCYAAFDKNSNVQYEPSSSAYHPDLENGVVAYVEGNLGGSGGEWVEYNLPAMVGGEYRLELEVGTPIQGQYDVDIYTCSRAGFARESYTCRDEVLVGSYQLNPFSGSWSSFVTNEVILNLAPTNSTTLRIHFQDGDFNLKGLTLHEVEAVTAVLPTATPTLQPTPTVQVTPEVASEICSVTNQSSIPGTISAANCSRAFDLNGLGATEVSYQNGEPDVQNGVIVSAEPGEYVDFYVNVAQSGNYEVGVSQSHTGLNGFYPVNISLCSASNLGNGSTCEGKVDLGNYNIGSYGTYMHDHYIENFGLPAGEYVIRIEFRTSGLNVGEIYFAFMQENSNVPVAP